MPEGGGDFADGPAGRATVGTAGDGAPAADPRAATRSATDGSGAAGGRAPRRDPYAVFAPLFVELAELSPDAREREHLRARIIREHLRLARNIARRFARRGEPLADLEQVAMVGLINAVDRFDPHRGTEFLGFAVPTITGELRRHFRDHGWATHVPRRLKDLHVTLGAGIAELSQRLQRAPTAQELAQHLDLPLDDVVDGLAASGAYRSRSLEAMTEDTDDSPGIPGLLGRLDPDIEQAADRHVLGPLIAELPPRERTILLMRFFGNKSQTQIAEHVGISQMHVSRLLTRTLAQLREKLDGG